MLVRWNRFGRFLGCSGYPECQSTRSLDGDRVESGVTELGIDEATGAPITLRAGPYGPYLQLGEGDRPRRVSLPRGRDPASVDPEYARKLLALPRALGTDPASGKPVTAGLGRYGPYVERAGTYRNLRDEEHLFSVQLEEALELLARQQGRAVLRDMGTHPETGVPLQVLDGRYGPYVTDGAVNASLPKGTSPDDLTMEEAVGLLEVQARKGGAKGRGGTRGRSARSAGPKGAAEGSKRASTKSKVPAAKGKPPRAPRRSPGSGREGGKG
jgi:DNA topoisomerase I